MPNKPKSAFAWRICKNFRYDDFKNFIIEGDQRIGKSAYAIKVAGQVLEYFYGRDKYSWKTIRPYLGWDVEEVSETWLNMEERIPLYIWDDAGYWLHSLNWTDPTLQAIQKYFNVIGTDINTPIMTTPSATWILSKIQKMPATLRIKIIKRDGGDSDSNTRRNSRIALCYRPWRTPDGKKHGVNKIFKDDFNCYLNDELYAEYFPLRKKYAMKAKEAIRDSLITQRK